MTTTTEPPEGMVPEGAVNLIAQIVGANVANLAHATDAVEDGLRREIRALAETVVGINQTLAEATVIDRATEHRLRQFDAQIEHAYRTLERSET